jgi:UDP-N-acetylmuramate dehydrogenase
MTVLDTNSKNWLKDFFGEDVLFDELMSKHTSLRVGGPADSFVSPKDRHQLVELIGWACDRNIPYLVVGEGTNLLVRDKGIRAIVISLSSFLNKIMKTDIGNSTYRIDAMAGMPLRTFCKYSINNGLSGMNFALGIPGTIGGGIKMNAGTAYGSMESVIHTIQLLFPDGNTKTVEKEQLNFGYRDLWLRSRTRESSKNQPIILNGSFILYRANSEELKKDAEVIIRDRKKKQPIGQWSAGCFFKNPSQKQPAGLLMDQAGLKGKTKGGAKVSTKHANFLLNTGNASAADILSLMEYAQEKVFKQFHIRLEPEVKIVGE